MSITAFTGWSATAASNVDLNSIPLSDSMLANQIDDAFREMMAQLKAGVFRGTTTNDSAATGFMGEYVSSSIASGSAVSLTTGTDTNITSISLTAGDWDVGGQVSFSTASTTNVGKVFASVGTTSATINNFDAVSTVSTGGIVPGTSTNAFSLSVVPARISIASTTTVYLIARGNFTVSTCSGYGILRARRVR